MPPTHDCFGWVGAFPVIVSETFEIADLIPLPYSIVVLVEPLVMRYPVFAIQESRCDRSN